MIFIFNLLSFNLDSFFIVFLMMEIFDFFLLVRLLILCKDFICDVVYIFIILYNVVFDGGIILLFW